MWLVRSTLNSRGADMSTVADSSVSTVSEILERKGGVLSFLDPIPHTGPITE